MLDVGIPVPQLNMKDPYIAQMALNRLKNLSEIDKSKTEELSSQLFNDISLKYLLNNSDEEYLSSLFQQLPAKIFLNNLNTLIARWPDWTSSVASWSAPIIAELNPKQANELFIDHLDLNSNPFADPNKIFGIVESLNYLPAEDTKTISNKLIDGYLSLTEEEEKLFFAIEILELAWKYNHPEFHNILREFLKNSSTKQEVHFMQGLSAISHLFAKSNVDFNLIADQYDNFSTLKYTSISLFFKETFPLSDIDKAVDSLKQKDFEKVQKLFQEHSSSITDSKLKDLLENLLADKNILDNLEDKKKAYFFSFILGCLVASLRTKEIAMENLSLKEVIEIISADIEEIPSFNTFVSYLKEKNKEEVANLLIEALNGNLKNYGGSHIIDAMGDLGYDQFKTPLTEALLEEQDYIFLGAERALLRYGEKALDSIRDIFKNKKKGDRKSVFSVITKIGGNKAIEFIDEIFESLWLEDKENLLTVIQSLPDKRFIKRLEPFINKGQNKIDLTYVIVNKLHKRETPEINSLIEKLAQQEKEQKEYNQTEKNGSIVDSIKPHIDLELKCKKCGDKTVYRIKEIIVSQAEMSKPIILDTIDCVNCNETSEFDLAPKGFETLSAEIMRFNMSSSQEESIEMAKKSPIKFRDTIVKGKEMGLDEGIKVLLKEIEKKPRDPENYIDLGYAYNNIKKYSEAEENYKKAIEIDRLYIEPYYFLGAMAYENNDSQQAFEWLNKGSEFIEKAKYRKNFELEKTDFGKIYADLFNDLQRQTRLEVPMPAMHPGVFGPKTGRNDPCICGSGKKYKKCCMK